MAEGPAAVEEERRLLYVGLTRARRELRLSWAGARTPGGRATPRPSRFLDGAAERARARAPAPRRSRAAARPARASRPRSAKPARVPDAAAADLATAAAAQDRPLRRLPAHLRRGDVRGAARLAARRSATETKVPAYVVFTDATLTAIAEREPSDIAALATHRRRRRGQAGPLRRAVLSILGGCRPWSLTAQNASAAAKIRGARRAVTTRRRNFYVNYVARGAGAALA